MKQHNISVYIQCPTFNQASYIVDTMNGFTMQQTSFPYVCGIIDDASTDGEPEVIREYLKKHFDLEDQSVVRNEETDDYLLCFAQHKTNKNCYFAVYFLKYNHYSIKKTKLPYISTWRDNAKYISICEGDDYWIEPFKLQKQVDFLESHPNISYVCTRFNILNQKTSEIRLSPNTIFDNCKNEDLEYFEFNRNDAFQAGWITKTLTCMYRLSCYDNIFVNKFNYFRDVHMIYMLLSKGNGVCFNFVSGVYRLNEESTFGGRSILEKKRQNYLVYEELYNYTGDKVMLERASSSYIKLFKGRYKSYSFPHNFLQLYSIFLYWPLKSVKKLLNYLKTKNN